MPISNILRDQLAEMVNTAGVPGCALAVVRGGAVSTLELGYADLAVARPVERDTVFHYFSGTKLYTAAVVMQLRDRGLLELDAPVTRYLPELDLAYPVTVRQLLTHTSGLPRTLAGFMAVHLSDAPAPTSHEALARYRTRGGRRPGGRAKYRNVGYAILGALVARLTGGHYVDAVRRELLEPLGSRAVFEHTETTLERAAVGYLKRFGTMRWLLRLGFPEIAARVERERVGGRVALADFALDTAAIGGLLGSASDLLPLVEEMLREDDGVLRASTRREMLTLQARGRVGFASKEGVGLGWKRGRDFWNHEGGGPGFTSETRIYPEARLGVVLLMNTTQTPGRSRLAHAICEHLRA